MTVDATQQATAPPAIEPATAAPADVSPRRAEVDRRYAIIVDWLEKRRLAAIMLFDPDNFSWATAGGQLGLGGVAAGEIVFLYVSVKGRCVVCTNEHTSRLFECELDGLGFQLKEFGWERPIDEIVSNLTNGSALAADRPMGGLTDLAAEFAVLREQLSAYDVEQFRSVCQRLSHAVEATCRSLPAGQTEWETAGHLAHRMFRHQIEPVAIHIFADGRALRSARPRPAELPIDRYCTILATGRAGGMYATTSRTISFGPPTQEFLGRHRLAALITGTYMRFSLPGTRLEQLINLGKVVYRQNGCEFLWLTAPPGGQAGYHGLDDVFRSAVSFTLQPRMALRWHAMVQDAVSADCVITAAPAGQSMFHHELWPTLTVTLRDQKVERPDVLVK